MTCCVMSRWYRSPEVILTHSNYGKSGDIWGLGIMLSEMMACSDVYHKEDSYHPKRRFFFKGQSCYPISPEGKNGLEEDDQIIKILSRYENLHPDTDFSFIVDENEKEYLMQAY